ncbi:hypothetical protein ELI38_15490 [Rhizobium leguminosarum]|uniref:DUF7706 family protein n=1 Tax=Rhizobium leguminosarum TaxID=384 RepID=UPI0010308A01|nr:hypothetical protein [Rhizobium leguminosarum]TAU97275.1 hypothetical protein ELI38_15490 [Rhizobium leguminosarum]
MIRISIDLTDTEALALAQMSKRMIIDWVRPFSASEQEAQLMWDALCKVRRALRENDVAPR